MNVKKTFGPALLAGLLAAWAVPALAAGAVSALNGPGTTPALQSGVTHHCHCHGHCSHGKCHQGSNSKGTGGSGS